MWSGQTNPGAEEMMSLVPRKYVAAVVRNCSNDCMSIPASAVKSRTRSSIICTARGRNSRDILPDIGHLLAKLPRCVAQWIQCADISWYAAFCFALKLIMSRIGSSVRANNLGLSIAEASSLTSLQVERIEGCSDFETNTILRFSPSTRGPGISKAV
jgi:hypothetical protein